MGTIAFNEAGKVEKTTDTNKKADVAELFDVITGFHWMNFFVVMMMLFNSIIGNKR